jgi:hypothetical protein
MRVQEVSESLVGNVILGSRPKEITLLKNSGTRGEEGASRDKRLILKSPAIISDLEPGSICSKAFNSSLKVSSSAVILCGGL